MFSDQKQRDRLEPRCAGGSSPVVDHVFRCTNSNEERPHDAIRQKPPIKLLNYGGCSRPATIKERENCGLRRSKKYPSAIGNGHYLFLYEIAGLRELSGGALLRLYTCIDNHLSPLLAFCCYKRTEFGRGL